MPTVVSVFDRPQDVAAAVKKLKGRGFGDIETYSPAPFEEIDDAVDPKPSESLVAWMRAKRSSAVAAAASMASASAMISAAASSWATAGITSSMAMTPRVSNP